MRVGQGVDVHRLGGDGPLILLGVEVSADAGLLTVGADDDALRVDTVDGATRARHDHGAAGEEAAQ